VATDPSAEDVEAVREALRGAMCTCGHDAEWHSGLMGCNAEDYTMPATACECDEDWVGAIVPALSRVVVPARVVAEVARLRAAIDALADEWTGQSASGMKVACGRRLRAALTTARDGEADA
jgi:hypothetical protein